MDKERVDERYYLQTKSTLPLGTTSFNSFVNSVSEGCKANARIAVPTSIGGDGNVNAEETKLYIRQPRKFFVEEETTEATDFRSAGSKVR